MANDDNDPDGTDVRDGDYEVGYRRPPRHTRFKPGQSGNPAGRSKKKTRPEETFMQMFGRVTGRSVRMKIGDRQIEIPKIEAILEQMCAVAGRGNVGAFKELVRLAAQFDAAASMQRQTPLFEQTDTDDVIIERFVRRRRGAVGDLGEDEEKA